MNWGLSIKLEIDDEINRLDLFDMIEAIAKKYILAKLIQLLFNLTVNSAYGGNLRYFWTFEEAIKRHPHMKFTKRKFKVTINFMSNAVIYDL